MPNKVDESGRLSGFLSNSLLIMSLIKGETVGGSGEGSFSLINFNIS
jgi:hypothetical protein